MRLVVPIAVMFFSLIVVLMAIVFLVMEAQDRIETLREKAPWIMRFIERRESLNVLLVACLFMLAGNGYELLTREVPEVPEPPTVVINAPAAPTIPSLERGAHLAGPPQTTTPTSVTQSPPPVLTGIRIASQKRVPSDDPKMPYGLEVVLQTDADIEPVAIAVVCDGVIGRGNAGFSGGGVYTVTKQGVADGHPNIYLTE